MLACMFVCIHAHMTWWSENEPVKLFSSFHYVWVLRGLGVKMISLSWQGDNKNPFP